MLTFCEIADARMLQGVAGAVAANASSCSTQHATNSSAHSLYTYSNPASGDAYYVGQWSYDPGSDISICKITLILKSAGTISGNNYTVDIYTLGGGTPSALDTLLGSSEAVAGNNSWDNTSVDFSFSSAVAASSGTNYAIVLRSSGAASDTNTVGVSHSDAGGLTGYRGSWNSSKTGTGWGTDDVRMTIYKE